MYDKKKVLRRIQVAARIHPALIPVLDAIAAARGVDRSDELRRIIEYRVMRYALEHPKEHAEAAKIAQLTLTLDGDIP